jgi:hypothetical protein
MTWFSLIMYIVIGAFSSFVFMNEDNKLKRAIYTVLLYSAIVIPLLVLYDSKL